METLAANRGVIEINFGIDLEALTWLELCPAIAMLDRDGRRDDENPAPAAKLPHTGTVDGLNDRQAAAIKDWRLAPVYLDDGVVNAKPGKGGHDMLDRFQSDTVVIDNPCAQPSLANRVRTGGDCLPAFGDIDTTEQNTGIGRGGMNGDANEPAGMKADAVE